MADKEPLRLPGDVLKTMGVLHVNYTNLEYVLSFYLWKLAFKDQHKGQALTAWMNFERKVDALRTLLQMGVIDEPHRGKLEGLLKNVDSARKARNALVHSLLITDGVRPSGEIKMKAIRIRASGDGGLKHKKEQVTAGKIRVVAEDLRDCGHGLTRLATEMFGQAPVA